MKRVLLVIGIMVLMNGCQSASEDNLVKVAPATPLVSPAPVIIKKTPIPKAPIKPRFVTLEEREKQYITEALEMMDKQSPGFKKDMIDDDYRLQMVQDSLHKPIELVSECDMLDEKWRNTETVADALQIQIDQLGKWWAITPTEIGRAHV
jgi:PBP1b-binding outer membrane lipoprotein LpoB